MRRDKNSILALVLLLANGVYSHLSCRLSEGGQNAHDDIIIRGGNQEDIPRTLVGPPGKQGPRGQPGETVCCKPCDIEDLEVKIKALEDTNALLKSK